jgi:hypothetical protein
VPRHFIYADLRLVFCEPGTLCFSRMGLVGLVRAAVSCADGTVEYSARANAVSGHVPG